MTRCRLYRAPSALELEVARLLSDGVPADAIADRLRLRTLTVRWYIRSLGLKIPGTLPARTKIIMWYRGCTEPQLTGELPQ